MKNFRDRSLSDLKCLRADLDLEIKLRERNNKLLRSKDLLNIMSKTERNQLIKTAKCLLKGQTFKRVVSPPIKLETTVCMNEEGNIDYLHHEDLGGLDMYDIVDTHINQSDLEIKAVIGEMEDDLNIFYGKLSEMAEKYNLKDDYDLYCAIIEAALETSKFAPGFGVW